MNMWRVGEDMGSKEMDGCPLTGMVLCSERVYEVIGSCASGWSHSRFVLSSPGVHCADISSRDTSITISSI
jgi:hypothetical protein